MISLLTGNKGSGKTKKLIELATKALQESQGNVVVIEKGKKLTYDISHKARLIDTEEYDVKGKEALCGFLAGLCAGNYDLTDIFVDSTLKITGSSAKALEFIVPELEKLSQSANVNFVLSVSCSKEDIPELAAKYVLQQ